MKSGEHFDVIIIGAGPSGIFCAYELIKEKPELNILMIEKGRPIEKRVCPKRKTKVCVGCKPCSITTGFAGAGAFSDGKLSLSPDVGGNLPEILGYDKATELIRESDDIYLQFGADKNVYGVDKQQEIRKIRKKAINANLKLIECPIRHLGTEEGYKIYTRLQEHLLANGIHMEFNTMVKDIIIAERLHQVASCEVLVRGEYAVRVLTRDSHESRKSGTGTDEDCLVALLVHQLVDRYRLTDNYVCLNINTELLHILDLRLYDTLFRETEFRDTVG